MAETIAEATQAPLDSAIAAVIGGVSVAVVGKALVEICPRREWQKPIHTYVGIEQDSGTGKTPVIGYVKAPIDAWESIRKREESPKRRWADEQVQLELERVKQIRRKAAKNNSEDAKDELEDAVEDLRIAEEKALGDFQFLIQDATEEEVVRLLWGNQGRTASVDSEATLLELAAGRYGNGDARLAVLTNGWDGTGIRVNRVKYRHAVDVPSVNLALLVGLQPGILKGMLNAETMRQRGVLARFLWVAPTTHWDQILTGRDVPSLNSAAVERYGAALTWILDSSDKSEGGPHLLKMSPEAQEGVYRLERAKVEGIRPGGPLASVPAFGGKLPDHGSRIAALLTVADRASRKDDLFGAPIPGWAMEAAERLISAISTHVVKVLGNAGCDPKMDDLRYLLGLAKESNGDTESEIRERARAREVFRDAEYAGELFDELEKRGCVRRIPREKKPGPGRNPSPLIEVHPGLLPSDKSELSPPGAISGDKSERSEVFGVQDTTKLPIAMTSQPVHEVTDLFSQGDGDD